MTKRKVFISYHHANDQAYKDKFEEKFSDIFINKSVQDGDINTDVSTDYIKRLIQSDHLKDTSVLVVLIGSETYKRKHVDWEISAALSAKAGGYSGLIGITLPSYKCGDDGGYFPETIPPRLLDNVNSGYAAIYKWDSAFSKNVNGEYYIKSWIDAAFDRKNNSNNLIKNSREQFKYNR